MVRLIWATIDGVDGAKASCHADSNANITFDVYLNPLDQSGQAGTKKGSRIIALYDDVQGLAVCVYNTNGFAFKFSHDLDVTGGITASGDVSAGGDISTTTGDVTAGLISLTTHVHTCAAPGSPSSTPIPSP